MSPETEELHQVPLELASQDLKEIIEIGTQITAQLEVENIIKNVVLSLVARFQSATVTALLPGDYEEEHAAVFHFAGTKRRDLKLDLPSIRPLLAFLAEEEYNQVSFSYLRENIPDGRIAEALEAIQPDILVPLRTDKGLTGLVLLPKKGGGQRYSLLDIQYITQIARFAAIAVENANLYWQATTDRMTNLFSHHYFKQNLDDEIARAHRYGTTFSLIMLDIDHFKKFNDTYGHLQGDVIIKEIADILRRSVRGIDFSARYGGEEFAVVLPEVDARGAQVVAERIRTTVERWPFTGEEQALHVTVSLGVSEFVPQRMHSPAQLIAEADRALYQSKELGRNRTTVASR